METKLPAGSGPEQGDQSDQQSNKADSERRVFIVEDEKMLRDLYADILSLKGHKVESFASGEEALQGWSDKKFKLIICDLGLPGMNGWDLITKIRETDKTVPVVVLTGWVGDIDQDKMKENKVQRVLAKPVTIENLIETINELCD